MRYLKRVIRDNYRMWLCLIGVLFLLTVLSIIIFCFIAAGKEKEEVKAKNKSVQVEYYGVEDEILTNFLNSCLTPLDVVYRDEKFDIRLLGYFSDGHCVNIYFDLVLDADNKFAVGATDYWDVDASVLADNEEIFNYGHYIGNEGNTYHFYAAGCTGEDITGSEICFQVKSVRLVRHRDSNINYDAYFNYSFINDEVYFANQFPVNSNVDIGYYGQGYLQSVKVSPFGISFNWREHREKNVRERYSDTCVIKDTDGKDVHVVYRNSDYIYWDIPIRTSMISSLEFGSYTYSFIGEENALGEDAADSGKREE